jgi:hypothetical protein
MLKNFTMPKKFSYSKRPITLTAELNTTCARLTGKLEKKIINRAAELAGTVPFDWVMMDGCFVAFFGFETWELALAAQARLQNSNFGSRLWNQDEENQILGNTPMTPREFLKRNSGDHPWWDSITDDQLDAVMEKYKFNKEDLDDLTNARVIICELAHGPPRFSEDACYCVGVTCDGDRCINPAHLEWVELSPNSTH